MFGFRSLYGDGHGGYGRGVGESGGRVGWILIEYILLDWYWQFLSHNK